MTTRRELLDFEKQLEVDRDRLDEELSNFPSIFYTVTDHYLEARKHVKRLEARLDRTSASLSSALRSAALQDEGKKAPETQLKQEVSLHPKYKKMKSKLSDAVYIQDRWSALKDAFIQKSFALKGLVSLVQSEQYQVDSAKTTSPRRGRKN